MTHTDFARAFERGKIANASFHHLSHLRLAWTHLEESSSIEEAIAKMRDALQRFTANIGKSEKYHETVTSFWLRLLSELRAANPAETLERLVQRNPQLLAKDFPLTYYSPQRLFSEPARTSWLEPDLKKISANADAICSSYPTRYTSDCALP